MDDVPDSNIPTDRRLTAKEAVFAIAFNDIEGGELYEELLSAENGDNLNDQLLAAAIVIERAAAMGNVNVRGKEKVTHGSADIKPIPDYEWDGLKLEIDAIKPPAVDSVYGATVDVRGRWRRETRYVCLSFDPEQITELHNKHYLINARQENIAFDGNGRREGSVLNETAEVIEDIADKRNVAGRPNKMEACLPLIKKHLAQLRESLDDPAPTNIEMANSIIQELVQSNYSQKSLPKAKTIADEIGRQKKAR